MTYIVSSGALNSTHSLTHSPDSIFIWRQHQLVSRQAHRATHWTRVRGPAALVGVWLRTQVSEISAAQWSGHTRCIYMSGLLCCIELCGLLFCLLVNRVAHVKDTSEMTLTVTGDNRN